MAKDKHADGELGETVRDAAARIREDLAQTARDARDAAENLSEALRHSASDAAERVRMRGQELNRDFRGSVRDHPVAWLGAAAGAGALVGLLLVATTQRHPDRR